MNSPAPASPAGPAPDDGLVEDLNAALSAWREFYGSEGMETADVLAANDAQARAALRAHTAQPAAVVRCAECDCEAGGEACNWIKRGPAAGVLEPTDEMVEAFLGAEVLYDVRSKDMRRTETRARLSAALAAAPRAGVPEG